MYGHSVGGSTTELSIDAAESRIVKLRFTHCSIPLKLSKAIIRPHMTRNLAVAD